MGYFPKRQFSASPRGGFRSGLEADIADNLKKQGTVFEYETLRVSYTQPEKPRTYTPDFDLDNGIIVEAKGRFLTADRQKHKFIKAQHPDLDIRFVFSNPNAKINKGSKTSYADWCDRYGFKYAAKLVPVEWMQEPAEPTRLAAVAKLTRKEQK